MTPVVSKYAPRREAGTSPGATVTTRLYPKDAIVPSEIRLFMSADRWESASQPVRWMGQPE